jgi:AcrR family transcriptional regulator
LDTAVKGRTPPTGSSRAAASRTRISRSAHVLFLRDGYAATSMSTLAEHADVAVQTIYNTVGNKAAVLDLVLDVAASGPDAPTPVRTLMEERAASVGSAAGLVDLLTGWFADVHPRIAPVLRVISEAAAADPAVARLERAREQQRYDHYRLAAAEVEARGGLADDTTLDQAAAAIWSLAHPVAYRLLVEEAGWTHEAYTSWLRQQLTATLLGAARPATS